MHLGMQRSSGMITSIWNELFVCLLGYELSEGESCIRHCVKHMEISFKAHTHNSYSIPHLTEMDTEIER